MLAGGSVTAPASVVSDSGAAGIHLMNQRDNFWEASGGEWKSTKITRTFPKNWPLYKWPKKWKFATSFMRSLTLLSMLQEDHKGDFKLAFKPLKLAIKEEKKSITRRKQMYLNTPWRMGRPTIFNIRPGRYALRERTKHTGTSPPMRMYAASWIQPS